MQNRADALYCLTGIEHTVMLAFRTAYLLTANVRPAAAAVLEAIGRFDPDRDPEEALFQDATRTATQYACSKSPSLDSFEQPELQAVLALPDDLRRCFVLRVLVRLSPGVCARLLRLSVSSVNEFTGAALQRLAGLDSASCSTR